MSEIKVLILEDEGPAAQRLCKLLGELRPFYVIDRVIESGAEAIEHLRVHPLPDLILSDVELSDGLCFEVFSQTGIQVPVIFTTAYNDYAVRAFETHAVDYLLKPIHKDKLERSLHKFELRKRSATTDYSALETLLRSRKESKRYIVKYGQKIHVLKLEDVAYFYSMDKSTFAVDKAGKSFPLDESLSVLEKDLPPREFFRINRNMIVHIDSFGEMRRYSKGRVRLMMQPEHFHVPHTVVSVERYSNFHKWLSAE